MKRLAGYAIALACILGTIAAGVWAQTTQPLVTYVTNLPAATQIGTGDLLYVIQSGIERNLSGNFLVNPNFRTITCGSPFVATCTLQMNSIGGPNNQLSLGSGGSIEIVNANSGGGQQIAFPVTPGTAGQYMSSVGGGISPMIWSNPTGMRNIAARFGSMDICQRGSGATCTIAVGPSATAYTIDGCYISVGANQVTFSTLQPAGQSPGSTNSIAVGRNNGQTGTSTITWGCPLDSDELNQMHGNFVTLSFYVAALGGWSPVNGTLSWFLICGTGNPTKAASGFTGQTNVISGATNLVINAAPVRPQGTTSAVVPNNCTQAEFTLQWTPVGTAANTDGIVIDSAQIEVVAGANSVATPFQELDFTTKIIMAQRHFAKTFPYANAPVQNIGVGGAELVGIAGKAGVANEIFCWRYPVHMRAVPTVAFFNPGAANGQIRDETLGADLSASGGINNTQDTVCAQGNGNAGTAVGNTLGIHITVDAGI
jgi:hypothetical protein